MSDKSDTPRTDAVYRRNEFAHYDDIRIELMELARQLERELAEKEREIELLKGIIGSRERSFSQAVDRLAKIDL